MATLGETAKKSKDMLRPFGQTETLLYYSLVAPKLEHFLDCKLVAVKNALPKGPIPSLLKRGSREEPLAVKEIAEAVTPEFLEVRKTVEHLEDTKGLTPVQRKVWSYFLPRKLNEFFYATNGEGVGKPIERVFFDLDRGKEMTHEHAREAAQAFVDVIEDDADFKTEAGKLLKGEPFCAWTGSSFHVYLFFKKPVAAEYYEKWFQYSKNDPLANYTGKWVARMQKQLQFKV